MGLYVILYIMPDVYALFKIISILDENLELLEHLEQLVSCEWKSLFLQMALNIFASRNVTLKLT